jgi:signal transduction histidine kinase
LLVHRVQAARAAAVVAAAERERMARGERDRLVATITHDLAAPLTAIQRTIRFARDNTRGTPSGTRFTVLCRCSTA